MSVLVKGMEMPESCEKCKLDLRTDVCRAFDEWHKEHPYSIRTTDRLPDCSLVELPEKHGDLIDKQSLLKELVYIGDRPVSTGLRFIRESSTVIEAEGEG